MKANTCELRVVKDHMSPGGVFGNGRCCCQLLLRLQEGRMLINHKFSNYD
jgi:hypothetical protein